jgi:hypothetical protein
MNNFKDAFIQYGLDHGHIKPIKETVKKTIITENMIKYYLGDDFQKWLPEILTHVFNKPDSFNLVKKEIIEAWEQSQEANQ